VYVPARLARADHLGIMMTFSQTCENCSFSKILRVLGNNQKQWFENLHSITQSLTSESTALLLYLLATQNMIAEGRETKCWVASCLTFIHPVPVLDLRAIDRVKRSSFNAHFSMFSLGLPSSDMIWQYSCQSNFILIGASTGFS
jgi:hypothetical protein